MAINHGRQGDKLSREYWSGVLIDLGPAAKWRGIREAKFNDIWRYFGLIDGRKPTSPLIITIADRPITPVIDSAWWGGKEQRGGIWGRSLHPSLSPKPAAATASTLSGPYWLYSAGKSTKNQYFSSGKLQFGGGVGRWMIDLLMYKCIGSRDDRVIVEEEGCGNLPSFPQGEISLGRQGALCRDAFRVKSQHGSNDRVKLNLIVSKHVTCLPRTLSSNRAGWAHIAYVPQWITSDGRRICFKYVPPVTY